MPSLKSVEVAVISPLARRLLDELSDFALALSLTIRDGGAPNVDIIKELHELLEDTKIAVRIELHAEQGPEPSL